MAPSSARAGREPARRPKTRVPSVHDEIVVAPPAEEGSSSRTGRRVKRRVNRGLTCANCRARKTRCDGGQPGCKTCEVYQDQCRYEQLPPLSQVRALTRRLQDAEAMIRQMQSTPGEGPIRLSHSPPSTSSLDGPPLLGQRPLLERSPPPASTHPFDPLGSGFGHPETHSAPSAHIHPGSHAVDSQYHLLDNTFHAGVPFRAPSPTYRGESAAHRGVGRMGNGAMTNGGMSNGGIANGLESSGERDGRDDTGTGGQTSDLSLDANGQLCYYGPTSNVHDPPTHSPESTRDEPRSSRTDVRTMLKSKALESRNWEEFALGNAAIQSDIPRTTMGELLAIHWTWIAPMFMWVYRPAFMRDMTTGGQYFSQFLLTVVCAHSARFGEDQGIGEMLISRARLMLGNEIDKPISIPTVQALLQLSARDLAYGRISQAWLYSGMAFRMVSDLGLHHSNGKILGLGQLNSEDLEIRRRLFWSCYFWDKAISLYLGRMPVLLDLPMDSAPELLDDTVEHEIWLPHTGGSINLSNFSIGHYPLYKSHAISCFTNSCTLAVIINSIIQQLYSRRTDADLETTLPAIRNRLDAWRRNTPAHLILDPDNLPEHCPPPHILTQNLLYFTTTILLHRPFLSSPTHRETCRRAAIQTEKLLLLLESTFSFGRITYLMAYCIYTSSSVLLNDVKAGDHEASQRMQTLLRALRGGTATCPVLQRSLDIITNSLRSPQSQAHQVDQSTGLLATPYHADPRTARGNGLSETLGRNGHSQSHEYNFSAEPSNGGGAFGASADLPRAPGPDPNLMSGTLLPAFLFAEQPYDPLNDMLSGVPSHDTFSLLDCFPENRIEGFQGDWFVPT